jgi:hypothetical protein
VSHPRWRSDRPGSDADGVRGRQRGRRRRPDVDGQAGRVRRRAVAGGERAVGADRDRRGGALQACRGRPRAAHATRRGHRWQRTVGGVGCRQLAPSGRRRGGSRSRHARPARRSWRTNRPVADRCSTAMAHSSSGPLIRLTAPSPRPSSGEVRSERPAQLVQVCGVLLPLPTGDVELRHPLQRSGDERDRGVRAARRDPLGEPVRRGEEADRAVLSPLRPLPGRWRSR